MSKSRRHRWWVTYSGCVDDLQSIDDIVAALLRKMTYLVAWFVSPEPIKALEASSGDGL